MKIGLLANHTSLRVCKCVIQSKVPSLQKGGLKKLEYNVADAVPWLKKAVEADPKTANFKRILSEAYAESVSMT